ncbi:hypothetical protein AB0283_03370 [Micromonospora vinacea]
MTQHDAGPQPSGGPPPRHHLALMIWIAAFPTLTVLQLLLGDLLQNTPLVWRTLILVSATVPIVVFCLMPLLQRLRARLSTQRRAHRGGPPQSA